MWLFRAIECFILGMAVAVTAKGSEDLSLPVELSDFLLESLVGA